MINALKLQKTGETFGRFFAPINYHIFKNNVKLLKSSFYHSLSEIIYRIVFVALLY